MRISKEKDDISFHLIGAKSNMFLAVVTTHHRPDEWIFDLLRLIMNLLTPTDAGLTISRGDT